MNIDINEYINSHMQGKIVRRNNSSLLPALLSICGVALVVVAFVISGGSNQQTALLSIGVLMGLPSLVWLVLCLSGTLWHWHYVPTSSPMRRSMVYLSADDFRRCLDMLAAGRVVDLASLSPQVSTNAALQLVVSRDGAFALLQPGRLDSGSFEPAASVVELSKADIAAVAPLLRKK